MNGGHEEVERRFLVRPGGVQQADSSQHLVQGYLNTDPARVVRVRLAGERAWLTVKGPAGAEGTRLEIECDIPLSAARAILSRPGLCLGTVIEKVRSTIRIGDLAWEVDEFRGRNAGLRIAEVEYDGTLMRQEWNDRIDGERPVWLGAEITGIHRFANSALTQRPFDEWPTAEREHVAQGRLPEGGG